MLIPYHRTHDQTGKVENVARLLLSGLWSGLPIFPRWESPRAFSATVVATKPRRRMRTLFHSNKPKLTNSILFIFILLIFTSYQSTHDSTSKEEIISYDGISTPDIRLRISGGVSDHVAITGGYLFLSPLEINNCSSIRSPTPVNRNFGVSTALCPSGGEIREIIRADWNGRDLNITIRQAVTVRDGRNRIASATRSAAIYSYRIINGICSFNGGGRKENSTTPSGTVTTKEVRFTPRGHACTKI